jgi:hypothetical protein
MGTGHPCPRFPGFVPGWVPFWVYGLPFGVLPIVVALWGYYVLCLCALWGFCEYEYILCAIRACDYVLCACNYMHPNYASSFF